MADNVTLPGTGTSVAADDVGGALYQRVKIAVGADGAAADLAPGQAAMAASLPVVIASNQSAVPISDGSGSLTVDGTVTAVGPAADDAAAAGNPVPIGGVYQATVDAVDDGDVGRLRMTARRALIGAADNLAFLLTSAAPVPSGSDIVDLGGNAIESGDLEIRDTNYHYFVIPIAAVGFRNTLISIYTGAAGFDQILSVYIYPSPNVGTAWSAISVFSIPASSLTFAISPYAVGHGGTAGGATVANQAHYAIPALASLPYVTIGIGSTVAPTTGSLEINIARVS